MARLNTILRIDSSARRENSVTRALMDRLIAEFHAKTPAIQVITRDLADGVPLIDASWTSAKTKRFA
jgi:FMN-dependent NADH-azoreductase